jgi:two-component system, cell cycle response regulator DivK
VKRRLLIVDDVELDRELLVQLFEDAYDIDIATDGAAGVDIAVTTRPDVILMDVSLPRMNGLDAVRLIRAQLDDDVAVLAVSSSVMPGDRDRAIEAGCDGFIAKPVDDVCLVELVARLVERS